MFQSYSQRVSEYDYYPDCDDPYTYEDVFRIEGFLDFYDVTHTAAHCI